MQSAEIRRNRYALVSACRNEVSYIDALIDSVASQCIRPVGWVIVDDGSTDDTYARARSRSHDLPFVEVVKMASGRPRSFTSQVFAAQHGYERLQELNFDFVGFLDADIRVEPDYYEGLLSCLHADASLGLCGGDVIDKYPGRLGYIRRGSEEFHVPGGVQLFRRECFDQIGGYVPIDGGGQDTIADVMTLMHGWKVRVFPEFPALHLRPDGVATGSVLRRGMAFGRKYYLLGYHPLFYLAHFARRVTRDPVLMTCEFLGFARATWSRDRRPVTDDFVRFQRRLQLGRLRRAIGLAQASANESPASESLRDGPTTKKRSDEQSLD